MKVLVSVFLLAGMVVSVSAKEKPSVQAQAMIRRANEITNIWSDGPVQLRMRVKFFAVKSGAIDAEYEKVSASPDRWRADLKSTEFKESSIFGDGKVWTWSDAMEKPIRVRQFETALAALSQSIQSDKLEYYVVLRKLDEKKQPCAVVTNGRERVQDCFDSSTETLLSAQAYSWTFIYRDYQPFGSHLFPRHIEVFENLTLVAVATVVNLERTSAPNASLFEPPPGTEGYKACREGLGLPIGAKGGKLVKDVPPNSPGLPPHSGIISNDQVVYGIVGRDGKLHNIRADGMNRVTREAAEAAVREWRFEPFTVCGYAVEMPVGFTMNFSDRGGYIGHMGP